MRLENIYHPTAEELKAKIEALKKRRQEYVALQERLKDSGEKQISLTDPDSNVI
jgi:phage host-nuclease inhibitor protein Gam